MYGSLASSTFVRYETDAFAMVAYSNDNSNESCEPLPANERRPTRPAIERQKNVYSSTCIKLSSMWEKRNDGYLERLSATNAHNSEDF